MLLAGIGLFWGCHHKIKDDIEELQRRVSSLEEVSQSLAQQFADGALIKSITPLDDNAGWRIEFIGGMEQVYPESINIYNGEEGAAGEHGVTPKIEVRIGTDGYASLWYNATEEYPVEGWIDTNVHLNAPEGPAGPQGGGVDLKELSFRVETDPDTNDETLYVWLTVGEEKPIRLCPVGGVGPLAAIIENDNGTITFVMSDTESTQYSFARYSMAYHFEVVKVATTEGWLGGATIVFRVNPSTAFIPVGYGTDIERWAIDLVDHRAPRSYVTPTTAFKLESILPDRGKKGQYIATFRYGDTYVAGDVYRLTLVLDNHIDEDAEEELVSSEVFTVAEPNVEVAIDTGNFPDPAFRAFLASADTDGNGALSTYERSQLQRINLAGTADAPGRYTSVEGIENFPNLWYLNCLNNPSMTEFNVSKNPLLLVCYLSGSPHVTQIDLSNNTELRDLICTNLSLETLDVSHCPDLTFLSCAQNNLHTLTLDNPALTTLTCWSNQLTQLDLTKCPELASFRGQNNLLAQLDISHCPKLFNFFCHQNPGGTDGWFNVRGWFDYDSVTKPAGRFPASAIFTEAEWTYTPTGSTVNIRYTDVVE